MQTFPERLQSLRLAVGLTQRELARVAQVDSAQISRYEAGEAMPRPGVMRRLAKALNSTLEFLRDGDTQTLEDALAAFEKKRPKILISLPMDVRESLSRLARAMDMDMSDVVRLTIAEALRSEQVVANMEMPPQLAKRLADSLSQANTRRSTSANKKKNAHRQILKNAKAPRQ